MAHVAIVGAGIGGLAAALAFARRGWDVVVYEQADELREFGAGIQITPNGARVLAALGLGVQARERGLAAPAVEPVDGVSGRVIARFDLRGRDYIFFHRGDLLAMLAEAVRGAGVRIVLGARISGDDLPKADLVVGAGGLHCPLRAQVAGPSTPFFTEQVAWRAVIEGEHPPAARIWMGPGQHLVSYPLPGGQVNLVAVREQWEWVDEGWSHADDPARLREAFGAFAPEAQALLARVAQTHLWGLFRHEVATHWHRDGVALLGDCAHPTLPFLAQGANLALEDAWVLAACAEDLPRYEAARKPRVSRAIEAANGNAANYHLRGLPRRAAHHALGLIGRIAPGMFLGRLDWLYEYDAPAAFPELQASSSIQTGT